MNDRTTSTLFSSFAMIALAILVGELIGGPEDENAQVLVLGVAVVGAGLIIGNLLTNIMNKRPGKPERRGRAKPERSVLAAARQTDGRPFRKRSTI